MLTVRIEEDVSEITERRAKEVSMFRTKYMEDPNHFGSVEMSLANEVNRLQDLVTALCEEEIQKMREDDEQ